MGRILHKGLAICLTIDQWFSECVCINNVADYAAESKNQSHSAHHSSRSPNPTYAAHLSLLLASVTRVLAYPLKTQRLCSTVTHLPLLPFTGPQQAFEQINQPYRELYLFNLFPDNNQCLS